MHVEMPKVNLEITNHHYPQPPKDNKHPHPIQSSTSIFQLKPKEEPSTIMEEEPREKLQQQSSSNVAWASKPKP